MKIKRMFLIITIMLSVIIPVVHAEHECSYSYAKGSSDKDIVITYGEDKVTVEGESLTGILKSIRKGFSTINLVYEYEEVNASSPLLTESIDFAIKNDSCPGFEDEIFVCAGLVSSVNVILAQQVFGAGEFLATLVSPIWEEYDSFWDYLVSLGDSLDEITELGSHKEVLIVSGSQADAEQSYGYVKTGWFDINWAGFYRGKEDMDFSLYSSSTLECKTVYYVGKKTLFNLNCPYLAGMVSDFQESLIAYSNCSNDNKCKADNLSKSKDSETKLKEYCTSILANQDYYLTEGGKVNECMTECLNIKDKIDEIKKENGISISEIGECGFSERLLVWIKNILRWIKYILPVVVIIFGILDFIKAIGADKEDEMKKAQKRFIIRLIAAALVFIIPLILEFVLDKMGFGYNDCGLF